MHEKCGLNALDGVLVPCPSPFRRGCNYATASMTERAFSHAFCVSALAALRGATMFSAKTVIFHAIIPLLCRKHLPADFGKLLLHLVAHFSSLLPSCYQHDCK